MTKGRRITVGLLAACGIVLVFAWELLFHGYFDPGRFELKSEAWSDSGQVAMVSKSSDDAALDGDDYFVVTGDHVFTPTELRHAYHSSATVFATNIDCLAIRWLSSTHLEVSCNDASIDRGNINAQLRRYNGIDISYVNIPERQTRTTN
jgi:hypothetical protein